ncbi:MAG: YdcF family protein [Anaerolineae bacterium]|nr:YdcF family protein [Anaerolineae bacterium]
MLRRLFAFLLIGVLVATVLARGATALLAHGRIYTDPTDVSPRKAAIVFGAGVRNGQPSAVLYDRVAAAVALYEAGAVDKLLMSGDNRFANYNEPAVMRQTALRLGVPDADIVLDFAGRSTYETCYRARDIFGVRDVVLVTQRYHLDRAIFTCNALGLDAIGYPADRRGYRNMTWFQIRELGATLNAFLQLFVTHPQPVLGEPLPIE